MKQPTADAMGLLFGVPLAGQQSPGLDTPSNAASRKHSRHLPEARENHLHGVSALHFDRKAHVLVALHELRVDARDMNLLALEDFGDVLHEAGTVLRNDEKVCRVDRLGNAAAPAHLNQSIMILLDHVSEIRAVGAVNRHASSAGDVAHDFVGPGGSTGRAA